MLIFLCFGIDQFEWAHTELLWTIINLMMYTNHVINFISYCMTGTKFRRELLRLMKCHKFFKSLNLLFFTKIPEPTNTRYNNYTTPNRLAMNSQFDIELKDISNKPQNVSLKRTTLTTRIMDQKNKLLSLENCLDNEGQNKTIANLVINKFELKLLRSSLNASESCSSIGSSINSQPILSRFKYN